MDEIHILYSMQKKRHTNLPRRRTRRQNSPHYYTSATFPSSQFLCKSAIRHDAVHITQQCKCLENPSPSMPKWQRYSERLHCAIYYATLPTPQKL
jgi:hypothetical protein